VVCEKMWVSYHYGGSADDNGMDVCCWLGSDSSFERKHLVARRC